MFSDDVRTRSDYSFYDVAQRPNMGKVTTQAGRRFPFIDQRPVMSSSETTDLRAEGRRIHESGYPVQTMNTANDVAKVSNELLS